MEPLLPGWSPVCLTAGGAGVHFQSVFTSVSVGLPSHASAGDSSSV